MLEQLRVVQGDGVRSYHDLDGLLDEIRREYFPDAARPAIRWGKKITRKRRRSIRLGSYFRPSALIRIHPLLDSPDVPHFFIQSIIHHELLHHVLGAAHDRRFQRHERRFRFHREAREWLRSNLSMLLGLRERPRRISLPSRVPSLSVATRASQLSLW